jgi:hypothetical protein
LTEEVFNRWAALHIGKLTSKQQADRPFSHNHFKLGWRPKYNSSLLSSEQRTARHANSSGCNYPAEGPAARPSASAYSSKLEERIGNGCFLRFCRWFLFEVGTTLSAGAAIELFGLGERRLALLGAPLIQALHDRGYVPRAEEILAELIPAEGHEATKVIATCIGETRHDGLGAHSGWWRLLFQFIHDPQLRGLELLVDCMRGVGEFLLARYPEIRNSFRELVLSPQYERFRAALHTALNNPEPVIRHGAAMVLVTSDPET